MAFESDRYWRKPKPAHYMEIAVTYPICAVLRCLPVDFVSNLLGAIGRSVGPRLPVTNRARDNLRLVWPDIKKESVEKIIVGACDNFSRVSNEYWSLHKIRREQQDRLEIIGVENLEMLKKSGKSGIFFAGHIANWEMVTLAVRMHDLPVTVVYRPFNNPFMDALVRDWQRGSGVELIRKGREGARRLTQILKGGGNTIMLVDVRMNDGVRVPFLGLDAMTPSAPAALAIKYDSLLVPVRVERNGPAHFRITFEEPRPPTDTGNRQADIAATMTWVNDRFAEWISDRPEQWMWFHRRWGKNATRPD